MASTIRTRFSPHNPQMWGCGSDEIRVGITPGLWLFLTSTSHPQYSRSSLPNLLIRHISRAVQRSRGLPSKNVLPRTCPAHLLSKTKSESTVCAHKATDNGQHCAQPEIDDAWITAHSQACRDITQYVMSSSRGLHRTSEHQPRRAQLCPLQESPTRSYAASSCGGARNPPGRWQRKLS